MPDSARPTTLPPLRAPLPHSAAAVPMARALVRTVCTGLRDTGGGAVDTDTAELLTAELVANAVEHTSGDGPIGLVVLVRPAVCRVEVHDPDPRPPGNLTRPGPTVMPDLWQEGGRGLMLIRTLSSACGHRLTERGKAVWFTLSAGNGAAGLPAVPRPGRRG